MRVRRAAFPHSTVLTLTCVMHVSCRLRLPRAALMSLESYLYSWHLPRDLLTTHDSHLASQYVFRGEGQLEAAAA